MNEIEIKRLFTLSNFIDFQAGMDNSFFDTLTDEIQRKNPILLKETQKHISNRVVSPSDGADILHHLGNIDGDYLYHERRELLENFLLTDTHSWIRDGAGLGLSALDNPQSIPVLKQAIASEANQELKSDLTLILEQLEETARNLKIACN